MPDKKYYDTKKKEEVTLPSDYFVCNRCLSSEFAYEENYLFVSGESSKEFKQTCLKCGEVFLTDKKYMEDCPNRFILSTERAKNIEKLTEARGKALEDRTLRNERAELLRKNDEQEKTNENDSGN